MLMKMMLSWPPCKRRLILLVGLALLLGCGVIIYTSNEILMDDARIARLMSISSIRQSILTDPGGGCNIPDLGVNSSLLEKYTLFVKPIKCWRNTPDWVKCVKHTCAVKPDVMATKKWVSCEYRDILWNTDRSTTIGDPVRLHNISTYRLQASDFVEVTCTGEELTNTNIRTWIGFLVGIRDDPKLRKRLSWEKLPGEAMRYNVLMFGFDSLSRNTFIRKLPKSHSALEELGAHVLKGYNIVGDGTPQALIPILTGKTELELPETRKKMGKKAQHVDIYPFVWKDFEKFGYVTSYNEESPLVGVFTYRLKGFMQQPTDHYMRQYFVTTKPKESKWSSFCNGEIPRHRLMMDYTRQFMDAYSDYPKFVFTFHGELSHDDYNLVQGADEDFAAFLMGLKTSGILNNTILITMADHGHRFLGIRNTYAGKQEERLPWFSFVVPPDFPVRPLMNLKDNIKKLSTPFDIHATLLHVLGLNPSENYDIRSKFPPRSLSLFGPISVNRSCGQADVEPHWCACLTWRPISLTSRLPQRLADHLVMAINKLVSPFSDRCAELSLEQVEWAMKLAATDNMIIFKKSADSDGYRPDLSGFTSGIVDVYQIKIRTSPGGAIFEASLNHSVDEDSLTVKISDVSRINKYGEQARCVYRDEPELRKFCYCTRS